MKAVAAFAASWRQRAATDQLAHRPWPLPERPWFMGQTWERLLFAHWAVPEEDLRPVVPARLAIDTREGSAWVGVTPFRVRGLRLRASPPLPGASTFLEVNVRTYVTVAGRPGIYFLSLDAASHLAVRAARRAYRLPYFRARMSARELAGGDVEYRSARADASGPAAELDCTYRGRGRPSSPKRGSMEHFLTERYCLYTLDERQRIHTGEIHHPPWLLRSAEAEFRVNTMSAPVGIPLRGDPLLHLAETQDVVLWRIEPVE